jgi:hypothetical protein
MRNLYHFFYLLWRLDVSVWQVNEPTNTHTTAEKEREDINA